MSSFAAASQNDSLATIAVNVQADRLAVAPSAFDAAVGFWIQPDLACASGLAVRTVA